MPSRSDAGASFAATITSPEFWRRLVAAANGQVAFRRYVGPISGLGVALKVSTTLHGLAFEKDSARYVPNGLAHPQFSLAGEAAAWRSLFGQHVPFGQVGSPDESRLQVEGDFMASAWAGPPLFLLFEGAQHVLRAMGDPP